MNRHHFYFITVLAGLLLLGSCGHGSDDSPYGELLTIPPYRSLTDSIRREPDNDALYFRRAVLLNSNQQAEPALADFRKAWSLRKDERYALGVSTLLLDKQPDSAIAFLRNALRDLPASSLLQLSLARALDAKGNPDEALQLCNEVLRADSLQPDVLQFKASVLSRKGDSAAALTALEQAYTLAPGDIELNYELAFQYAESRNPKVLHLCDSLVTRDSLGNHAEPHYYKGIYYANTGDKKKALELFYLAIRNDYYYLNAYIEKSRILIDQKKWKEATAVLQTVNTLSPRFADGWYWLGQCQEGQGMKAEAKENYLRAYGLDNSFTEAKEAADRLK